MKKRDVWITDPTFDLFVAELSIGEDDGEDAENGHCVRRIQTIEEIIVEFIVSNQFGKTTDQSEKIHRSFFNSPNGFNRPMINKSVLSFDAIQMSQI